MNGYVAFKIYMSLKTHFKTKNYNIFKYNGKLSSQSREVFDARNDALMFERLAKRFKNVGDLTTFYVANFAFENEQMLYSDDAIENYTKWIKQTQSLSKILVDDLDFLFGKHNTLDEIFVVNGGESLLLKYYLSSKISLVTVIVLCEELNVIYNYGWYKMNLWVEFVLLIEKLKYFINYNPRKIENIINEKCLEFSIK